MATNEREEGRMESALRGLWQAALYALGITLAVGLLSFGVMLQFQPEPGDALRSALRITIGLLVVVSIIRGAIYVIRELNLAANASTQMLLETSLRSNRDLMNAMNKRMNESDRMIRRLTILASRQALRQKGISVQEMTTAVVDGEARPRPERRYYITGTDGQTKQLTAPKQTRIPVVAIKHDSVQVIE